MSQEKTPDSGSSAMYFLGFVGALVYYIQYAGSFWEGLLGVLKALFWPAFLVYRLLVFLGSEGLDKLF